MRGSHVNAGRPGGGGGCFLAGRAPGPDPRWKLTDSSAKNSMNASRDADLRRALRERPLGVGHGRQRGRNRIADGLPSRAGPRTAIATAQGQTERGRRGSTDRLMSPIVFAAPASGRAECDERADSRRRELELLPELLVITVSTFALARVVL